ncbi:hypothetical protein MBAV_000044 [Candidatus Magnetobacterium bavaricum]|uniref:Uncharacterized protein n=1 Tax=Candidatus Magnetobacterium bavaricum TaxID=29290 RepID=A0A0F3H4A5_9BACT|nr:hypothetical protein MBAV_000044 [Candidatus Magnetobacterium bavaricum]
MFCQRYALDGKVVCLRAAGCKYDLARLCVDEGRNLCPGILDGRLCRYPEVVGA